jgi:hypothetical protein
LLKERNSWFNKSALFMVAQKDSTATDKPLLTKELHGCAWNAGKCSLTNDCLKYTTALGKSLWSITIMSDRIHALIGF